MKNLARMACAVAALVAGQSAAAEETCEQRLEEVSAAWSETRAEFAQETDVTVSTDEGEVDVAAADAEPTENWFGKPPNADTVDEYLEAAQEAADAGDSAACLEQLKNVEEAMAEDTDGATEN